MTLTLLLATNNPHKVEEFRSIFLPYDVILQTPADLGLVNDVNENGNTYFENDPPKSSGVLAGGAKHGSGG